MGDVVFTFRCATRDETHVGMPTFGADKPLSYFAVPENERDRRCDVGGWLNAWLKPYPDTVNLKTRIHLRDDGIRPFIELEPTDHPLAVEQRAGISVNRVAEIYSMMMHDIAPNKSLERT